MEDDRKRRKVADTEEEIVEEMRERNVTPVALSQYGVAREIFMRADVSAVLGFLKYLKDAIGKDHLAALQNDTELWRYWFVRDFPWVFEAVKRKLPDWVDPRHPEKNKYEDTRPEEKRLVKDLPWRSPWMRFYTVTRTAVRSMQFAIIDHVEDASRLVQPMEIAGDLVGTDRVKVKLLPRRKYKDLFKEKFQREYEFDMSYGRFIHKYFILDPRGLELFPAMSGETADWGDPFTTFTHIFVNETLVALRQGFGETFEAPEADVNNYFKYTIDVLINRSEPVAETASVAWIRWFLELTWPNAIILNAVVYNQSFKYGTFYSTKKEKRLHLLGSRGLHQKSGKTSTGTAWRVGSSICVHCQSPAERKCRDCGATFCSEEHIDASGHDCLGDDA